MKIIKIIKLFLGLSAVSSIAFANIDNDDFNKKLDLALKHAQTHKSFEVAFTQEVYSALRDKVTTSKGILKVKAPHSWSFEVQEPRNELYLSNGVDFWKYVPLLKHAQHLRANLLEFDYISLLTNPVNIKKVYKISPWVKSDEENGWINDRHRIEDGDNAAKNADTENTGKVSIKLEPKGDKQQKVLYAIINVKTGILDELRVVQLNNNRVRLLFTEAQDKVFADKTFVFVPPQGIVVDKN